MCACARPSTTLPTSTPSSRASSRAMGGDSTARRYQGDKEIAEALGGQWQKAGFKSKVQVAEWGAYFKRYLGKQFQDAYLLGLGGAMQDADELYNLVSSKGRGLY